MKTCYAAGIAVAGLLLAALPDHAAGQQPRPMRVIVGTAAGGSIVRGRSILWSTLNK